MARSPFQGTFNPNVRPTVVTAPDALVYINGESDIITCPTCKKKFPFSKYITSIQVDLNIDSVPGSANVTMSIPRHAIDDFMFDGVPLISPMMEIEIYAKGYFLLEGIPQYYPIFWGIVTEVSDNYSSGEHTVQINCADILKWWELCKMNINPAFTGPSGQNGRSIFGNVFFGMNPYDVIFSLAQQSFGDVVIGTGSLTSLYRENAQQPTFNAALADIMAYWNERFGRIRSNLMLYGVDGVAVRGDALQERFRKDKVSTGSPIASSAVRNANGKGNSQMIFDPTSRNVVAFRTQGTQAGQVNFWQSEYQTKLELANAAKEAIGFEFFMDVTGDIVFKPPFYNLDILSNKPVSWIQDIDIIDWDFSDSESEVVTQLTIQGNFTGNIDWGVGEEATPYTSVTDYHLLRKYGWRSHTYNSEFMGDTQLMFYHGMDVLDRLNSKRHRGSITMPMRPEFRLGFPVYVAPKDQIWYVQGISHNIQFGGRATTTLTLTARRGKFIAPKGIGSLKMTGDVAPPKGAGASPKKEDKAKAPATDVSQKPDKPTVTQLARKKFTLDVGRAAETPPLSFDPLSTEASEAYSPLILRHPKTGRVCGYPNVVMVYTRPFKDLNVDQVRRATGMSAKGNSNQVNAKYKSAVEADAKKKLETLSKELSDENIEKLTKAHNANRWQYGLNSAGVFVYAHETEQAVTQFALLPVANISVKREGQDASKDKDKILTKGSAMIRPVSDERGFEVIGHFRYGRGISLRDGRLTLSNPDAGGGNNQVTNIGVQLALSGDLFASLHAQSQGLTTVSSVYQNPIEVIATMVPEDLQTAAVITPGKGSDTAKFVNTEKNLVDSAPLGSPEQKGVPVSVEASQLSRALTLAEMTIQEQAQTPDDNCHCSFRADLAFIAAGYAIKPLNHAAPQTDIFAQQISGQTAGEGGTVDAGSSGDLIGAKGEAVKPAELKFENFRSRVETYLFNLYKALDDTHQEYEDVLRGKYVPQMRADGFDTTGEPLAQEFGDLSPPFSAGNRGALGDPRAIAQQGSSAMNNLKQSWQNFGNQLKQKSEQLDKAAEAQSYRDQRVTLNRQLRELQDAGAPADQQQAVRGRIVELTNKINQIEAEIGVGR